ncbi:delta-1-pyrroline-5-carboxylate synthase-like isoform X2 [Oscarella lobularis]|uniref:delta-1-pyrroline-5-carboxylate synthase-like isoform X2 n=1 Tax=Oscarella lobularis TaxID=121494 RepID=UPI003313CB34
MLTIVRAATRRLSVVSTPNVRLAARTREELTSSRRIVVKLGSAVVTRQDECGIALSRVAAIVEQIFDLHSREHREVILVTSGAVALGKMLWRRFHSNGVDGPLDPRACAALGQVRLMSLYKEMFAQFGIRAGQILLSNYDLVDRPENLRLTISNLFQAGVIPILNGNDTVNKVEDGIDLKKTYSTPDNDRLSGSVARIVNADLVILLSDVNGIYTRPPGQPGAFPLDTFSVRQRDGIELNGRSRVGRGGMEAKVDAVMSTVSSGIPVVIANGCNSGTATVLKDVLNGKLVGTLCTNAPLERRTTVDVAASARSGFNKLKSLCARQRAEIIERLADLLNDRKEELFRQNRLDVQRAAENGTGRHLTDRLALNNGKLESLISGLLHIARDLRKRDRVGECSSCMLVAHGLELVQETVPIGVLMIIFESRPDVLPQVASLAISTSNGLLLKGGSEAENTNKYLHALVQEALSLCDVEDAVQLLSGRSDVQSILKMHSTIDMVIPRGSAEFVKQVKKEVGGHVPVLGHSAGICHVYVDRDADEGMAARVVEDSKCNYPAACNAMETLLVHRDAVGGNIYERIIDRLKQKGVKLNFGPKLSQLIGSSSNDSISLTFQEEYASLECTVETVQNVKDAIDHINRYGSAHTDAIVTNNSETATEFIRGVDSACVFHNSSTRFADGYRFGLGAEVGISTDKVHCRGPVGIEGLLTTRWVLRGAGHTVKDFASGRSSYVHKELPANLTAKQEKDSDRITI